MSLKSALKEIRELAEFDKPHWRVMYNLKTRETFVACLQSFDYRDYTESGFVDEIRYESEKDAEDARLVSHYYS